MAVSPSRISPQRLAVILATVRRVKGSRRRGADSPLVPQALLPRRSCRDGGERRADAEDENDRRNKMRMSSPRPGLLDDKGYPEGAGM